MGTDVFFRARDERIEITKGWAGALRKTDYTLRPDVRLRLGGDPSHNMQDFEGCAGLACAEPHA